MTAAKSVLAVGIPPQSSSHFSAGDADSDPLRSEDTSASQGDAGPVKSSSGLGSLVNLMHELEDICHLDIPRADAPPGQEPSDSRPSQSPSSSNLLSLPNVSSTLVTNPSAECKVCRLFDSCPFRSFRWRDNSLDWHIGTILQCDTWSDLSAYTSALQLLVTPAGSDSLSLNPADTEKVVVALDGIRVAKENAAPLLPRTAPSPFSRRPSSAEVYHDGLYEPIPAPQSPPDCLNAAVALLAKTVNMSVEEVSTMVAPKHTPAEAEDKVWHDMLRSDGKSSPEASPDMLTPNNRAMKGVSFDRSKRNWEASWLDARTGRRVKKCFSEGRWGNSARHMAVMARREAENSGVISTRCQPPSSDSAPPAASQDSKLLPTRNPLPPPLRSYRSQFPMTAADLIPNSVAASYPVADAADMQAEASEFRRLEPEPDSRNRLMQLVTPDGDNREPRQADQSNSRLVELLEEIKINPGDSLRGKPGIIRPGIEKHSDNKRLKSDDSRPTPCPTKIEYPPPVGWIPEQSSGQPWRSSWRRGEPYRVTPAAALDFVRHFLSQHSADSKPVPVLPVIAIGISPVKEAQDSQSPATSQFDRTPKKDIGKAPEVPPPYEATRSTCVSLEATPAGA